MKFRIAMILAAPLALAACGSSDNASTEAEADTVEIPANEALQGVDATPVADPNANATPTGTATPGMTEEEKIQADGDSAADTAAAAAAAMDETTEEEGQ